MSVVFHTARPGCMWGAGEARGTAFNDVKDETVFEHYSHASGQPPLLARAETEGSGQHAAPSLPYLLALLVPVPAL